MCSLGQVRPNQLAGRPSPPVPSGPRLLEQPLQAYSDGERQLSRRRPIANTARMISGTVHHLRRFVGMIVAVLDRAARRQTS